MDLRIIIPTYNERENIGLLAGQIAGLGLSPHIYVVDDSSPDGTGKAVRDLMKKYGGISLISREKKEGLGPAYIHAIRTIIGNHPDRDEEYKIAGQGPATTETTPCPPLLRGNNSNNQDLGEDSMVLLMDADLSHNPAYIPAMLEKLNSGSDVVVGSRYIRGGGIIGWPLHRLVLSRFGNLYADLFLRLGISDYTSGFILFRFSVLKKIMERKIRSNGYTFLIEIKLLASILGFRLGQVPIIFADRSTGHSKLSKKVILEAMLNCPLLAVRKFLVNYEK